mgnify:CR=1 FL=1
MVCAFDKNLTHCYACLLGLFAVIPRRHLHRHPEAHMSGGGAPHATLRSRDSGTTLASNPSHAPTLCGLVPYKGSILRSRS